MITRDDWRARMSEWANGEALRAAPKKRSSADRERSRALSTPLRDAPRRWRGLEVEPMRAARSQLPRPRAHQVPIAPPTTMTSGLFNQRFDAGQSAAHFALSRSVSAKTLFRHAVRRQLAQWRGVDSPTHGRRMLSYAGKLAGLYNRPGGWSRTTSHSSDLRGTHGKC